MRMMRSAIALALAAATVTTACSSGESRVSATGDREHGRLLLRQYGCGTCHKIPGVAASDGNVGPPLDRLAERVYLAGMLPNRPENMIRWIRAPQAIDPLTGMPDLKVPEQHARDMTAYLYTLR